MKKGTSIIAVLLCILLAFCRGAGAQSVSPFLIGSTGNFSTAGFGSISSSVGEPAVTTVTSGTLTLTQGFQQPQQLLACPTITSVSVAPSSTICAGNSVTITPNFIPVGGEVYVWSSGQTTSSISVAPTLTTVYTFSVQGYTGTIRTQTITVNPLPSVLINGSSAFTSTICSGTSSTLVSTPVGMAGYSWSPATGLSNPNISNPAASPTVTTTYTVTVTDANTCKGISSATVNVTPQAPVANAGADQTVCGGTSTTLNANNASPGTGTWTLISGPGSANFANPNLPVSTVTVTASGAYIFKWTITNPPCASTSATVTVNFNQSPALGISPSNPLCSGACNGSATVSASGGSIPYTFLWDAGQTTQTISNLCAGNYSVTVTDNSGCAATASVSIVDPNALGATLSSVPVLCNGGSTGSTSANPVGGTSPYTYSWTGGQTTSTATGLSQGNYALTLSDANNCSATFTVTVTEPSPLAMIPNPIGTSCASACDGSANSNPSGGTSPYSFAWNTSPLQTTQTATGLCAGSYTIALTDNNGCGLTAPVNIIPGTAVSPTITATQTLVCSGSPVTLTATGASAYVWNPGAQSVASITVSPTVQTTYTLTAINGSCSKDTTVTINVTPSPSASLSGTPASLTICNGEAITLTASPVGGSSTYSYAFSNGGGGAGINSTVVTPTVNISYSVVVTDLTSSCASSASVAVTVNQLPVVSITPPVTICSGSNATLTASGGTSYSWSSGQNVSSIIVSPTSQQVYVVTVTNSSGCSDTASTSVNVTTAPLAGIVTGPSTSVCGGTQVTLTATGGATYFWIHNSLSAATITETPAVNTTYTVVAYNGSCTDTAIQTITVSAITASISGNAALCVGNSSVLTAVPTGNAPFTYAWVPAAISQTVTAGPYAAAGQYTFSVTVTDAVGCTASAAQTVSVTAAPAPSISASTQTLCVAQTATLTGSGGSTYLWSNGATTSVINVSSLTAGSISYTLTASNGNCSADTSITISVLPLPSISAAISDPIICPGDSVTLTASGGIGYSWLGLGITNPITVFPSASTTYTVVGLGTNGCYNIANTAVTISNLTADAGADQTICPGFTAALNVTVSGSTGTLYYQWYPAVYLNDSTVQNPSATPDSTTTFMVEVSNQDGCHDKDTVTVHVVYSAGCVIHIYNGLTPNGDGSNDVWWIDGIAYFPDNNVSIFNRWGTEVWGASGYDNKNVVWKGQDQSGNALPNGTYYYVVRIKLDDGSSLDFSKWVELTK